MTRIIVVLMLVTLCPAFISALPFEDDRGLTGANDLGSLNSVIFVDRTKYTSLQAALTAVGTTGVIEVLPTVGTLSVPASATIPVGVMLRIDQGAILSIASGRTLTTCAPIAGPYEIFAGLGTVQLVEPCSNDTVRPEWWGAVPDGSYNKAAGAIVSASGTDSAPAFASALAALPPMNYPHHGTYSLPNGQLARTGRFLLSSGEYVVGSTLQWSPYVTYECPSYLGCLIALKNGVATSGPEVFIIDVQPVVVSGTSYPNETYGAQFKNIAVDCNGGASYGTNVRCSGVEYNGAQGSSLGTLFIKNFGLRGFWLSNNGGNVSGTGGPSDVEVLYGTVGPGIQLDAGFAYFGTLRGEHVNPAGTYKDADGDPNPGVLIGSAASNGAINVNVDILGGEIDGLILKIWGGSAISIGNLNLGAQPGGQSNAVIISHNAAAVSLGPMFTYAPSPDLFTYFVEDRTTNPATYVSGNFASYPSIQGYRREAEFIGTEASHAGQATCFKSGGQIGYCSTAVNSTGGCTCN
jgi:hypothetical protein